MILTLSLLSIPAILLLVTLYGFLKSPAKSKAIQTDGQVFPEGFLWSTGEDPYQHEGGNTNTDWHRWEQQIPSPIANGDTCGACIDFYNRYEEDFSLAKADGQNAHRIGIEWSRVEPEPGIYDEEAWEHYGQMLQSLQDKGFTIFLNLWHFTLPVWASDMGGFESDQVLQRWEAYVQQCARRFGKQVHYWSTMIDAQIYALAGYATDRIPPCVNDMERGIRMYRTLIHAHGKAYKILKKEAEVPEDAPNKSASVGMIYFFYHYEPKGVLLDRLVYKQMDRIFNWNMLDALYSGTIDINVLFGPTVREHNKDFADSLDWIGVNYYTRQLISFNPLKPGFINYTDVKKYETTDMDWEIYPEGLYRLCKKLEKRYPGVPLFIAESGLADESDRKRPQFILDHLAWVHKLIEENCPVFGFTYWSITDNWEWAEGFWPKFGLYEVNRETFERRPRKSATLFRFIATNNRLPRKDEIVV